MFCPKCGDNHVREIDRDDFEDACEYVEPVLAFEGNDGLEFINVLNEYKCPTCKHTFFENV